MKINKIVLYNFNSYEGLNEFDFTSENSSKNIILIGGKNGAGKTSLFMAIKLALYGPLSFVVCRTLLEQNVVWKRELL